MVCTVKADGYLLQYFQYLLTIRRKFQAKAFGKSLCKHLSRAGKYVITHELIEKMFADHRYEYGDSGGNTPGGGNLNNNDDENGYDEVEDGNTGRRLLGLRKKYSAVKMWKSKQAEKDFSTLMYEAAVDLLDPFHLGYITEEQCMAALCLVYKEQRFAATSLNDYGELHQSLRSVVDFFFWAIILVFLQAFLQLNILNYFLPFVTLSLTLSFALGNLVGNIFLAICFVFFMVPYEVGNKVAIGTPTSPRIEGFVKSISLLYTTITTSANEIVKIPNHTLFGEKIANQAESGGAALAVNVLFNLGDNPHSEQVAIILYCVYCL
jgi:hypothetical protein